MSYEKCSDEDQEAFVRLSVFEGSFSEDAAKVVTEKDELDTSRILKKLVSRSLIKQPTKHRYSIHLLIKYFLKDKQKIEERSLAAAMRAELLMVKYYLKLVHQLTMESYSKDGYKDNREALKREVSNIQNVLKICSQQEDPEGSDISDCLAHSKIYTSSAKFFSLFVRTIIPGSIIDEFLQQCAKMAETRKQHAIKIIFDCVLAYQERSKTIGKTDDDFNTKMEEIKKEFETHYKDLKDDKSLCAYFYYQYGRFLSLKATSLEGKERLDLEIQACTKLEESLKLRESLTSTPEGKADKIFSLMRLGSEWKYIGGHKRLHKNGKQADQAFKKAETYYRDAIILSKNNLGEHQLTSWCHKTLGDLFLTNKEPEQAEEMYMSAKKMLENLDLDTSEEYVLLLRNHGICLTESNRAEKAVEVLKKARDNAEKLAESDEPTVCKTKVYTSLVIAYQSLCNYSDARYYANKAFEFNQHQDLRESTSSQSISRINIKKYERDKLKEILHHKRQK